VAGRTTLFVTRADGWFWQRPAPSAILFWAIFSTAILGTLLAVYGVFVTPLGWKYALMAWVYALSWLVVNDIVKMAAYRMLSRMNS
jgi:H+-transporting ATPase